MDEHAQHTSNVDVEDLMAARASVAEALLAERRARSLLGKITWLLFLPGMSFAIAVIFTYFLAHDVGKPFWPIFSHLHESVLSVLINIVILTLVIFITLLVGTKNNITGQFQWP